MHKSRPRAALGFSISVFQKRFRVSDKLVELIVVKPVASILVFDHSGRFEVAEPSIFFRIGSPAVCAVAPQPVCVGERRV